MTPIEDLHQIIRTAEKAIAELAAGAMSRRAYADAAMLLEAASQIQQIGQNTGLNPAPDLHSVPTNTNGSERSVVPKVPSKPAAAVGRKPRKANYPQFFRNGDTLIKVGWSKTEGAEYEHKCPKRVLDAFVTELVRITGSGKRFTMDSVLPLRDPDTGAEFSAYQPYLALAFLRQSGLVEQHGRSGYSIPKAKTLAVDVDGAWSTTTSR